MTFVPGPPTASYPARASGASSSRATSYSSLYAISLCPNRATAAVNAVLAGSTPLLGSAGDADEVEEALGVALGLVADEVGGEAVDQLVGRLRAHGAVASPAACSTSARERHPAPAPPEGGDVAGDGDAVELDGPLDGAR